MTKRKPPEEIAPIMQIRIRDVVYPSVKVAAAKLNVSESNIRVLLHRGRVDRAGIGYKGYRRGDNKPPKDPKPIEIMGCKFPSLRSLSLYLGRSKQYASNVIRRYPDGMERLRDEYFKKKMSEAANTEMLVRRQVEDQMYEADRKRRY